MDDVYYYAERSRADGKVHIYSTVINAWSMTGDYLLFDSPEECAAYWEARGDSVVRT